jgi:hypothetical protein
MPTGWRPGGGGGGLTSPVGVADGGTGATTAAGARAALLPSTESDPGTTWDPASIGITYGSGRRLWVRSSGGVAGGRIAARMVAFPASTTIIAAWAPACAAPSNYGIGGVVIRDGTYAYVVGSISEAGGNQFGYARFDVSTGSGRTGLGSVLTQGLTDAWVGFRSVAGQWKPTWSPDGTNWYDLALVTGMPVAMTPTFYGLGIASDGVGIITSTRQLIAAVDAADFVSQIRADVGL